jgi:hypothetical protein
MRHNDTSFVRAFRYSNALTLDVSVNGWGIVQSAVLCLAISSHCGLAVAGLYHRKRDARPNLEFRKSITTLTQPLLCSIRTKPPAAVENWLPRKTSIILVLHLIFRNNALQNLPKLLVVALN